MCTSGRAAAYTCLKVRYRKRRVGHDGLQHRSDPPKLVHFVLIQCSREQTYGRACTMAIDGQRRFDEALSAPRRPELGRGGCHVGRVPCQVRDGLMLVRCVRC